MRRALLLAALLALSPVPGSLGAVCEGPREQAVPSRAHGKDTDSYQLPPSLLRRLYDSSVSLEGLLRVLSRASVGPKASSLAQKRDMHDFFVGLMGKRNTQAATPVDGNQEETPNFGTIKYPPDVE